MSWPAAALPEAIASRKRRIKVDMNYILSCMYSLVYLSASGRERVQERSELSLCRKPLRGGHGLVVEEAQQRHVGDQIATQQIRRRRANGIISDDHVFHCR